MVLSHLLRGELDWGSSSYGSVRPLSGLGFDASLMHTSLRVIGVCWPVVVSAVVEAAHRTYPQVIYQRDTAGRPGRREEVQMLGTLAPPLAYHPGGATDGHDPCRVRANFRVADVGTPVDRPTPRMTAMSRAGMPAAASSCA